MQRCRTVTSGSLGITKTKSKRVLLILLCTWKIEIPRTVNSYEDPGCYTSDLDPPGEHCCRMNLSTI